MAEVDCESTNHNKNQISEQGDRRASRRIALHPKVGFHSVRVPASENCETRASAVASNFKIKNKIRNQKKRLQKIATRYRGDSLFSLTSEKLVGFREHFAPHGGRVTSNFILEILRFFVKVYSVACQKTVFVVRKGARPRAPTFTLFL